MEKANLDRLLAARAEKRPVVVVTHLIGGKQSLVFGDDRGENDPVSDPLWDACLQALRSDRSKTVELDGERVFLHAHNPGLRMLVVGAVHITQALAPMAQMAGYEVTVIDPRRAFAADHRFPGVVVNTEWPDEALDSIGIDARTAVVTLTHDPKLDDPALTVALRSGCFYIGSLGSNRTHNARCERLREAGFSDDELGRIHGPVGLNIGAKSPAEIAISIMGQVTEALRRAD